MSEKYDAIFIDAFRTLSPPFQLTSIEAVKKLKSSLNSNGVVIVNIVSSLDGQKSEFFKREYATYKKIFPQIFVFAVETPDNINQLQNIILVAIESEKNFNFESSDTNINWTFKNLYQVPNFDAEILTDDDAPVENMILKSI